MAITPKEKTKDRAGVFLKAALTALKEAGGSLPLRDIKAEVAKRVQLTEHDLAVYEKTGYVRWESVLHFYSIGLVKAGFIRKASGLWHLTPEGEAITELSPAELVERTDDAYRKWKATQGDTATPSPKPQAPEITAEDLGSEAAPSFVLERAEGEARAEIENWVRELGPYEFQELVAALLRGMGYTTRFVAPRRCPRVC